MVTASKCLLDLKAEDLMSRDVLAIPHGMSLRAAAHRLVQAGVSGAPVTDDTGRCVGVLSRADLVRFIDQGPHAQPGLAHGPAGWYADWQVLDVEGLPADNVTRYMSTEVITAAPETRVGALARLMHEHHIHRVLITDPWGKVIGVVGSMDVLGAVAAEDNSAPNT
jgi:predicted transcriptional regulator